MISGVVVGIVKDNVDPDGLHRVLVEYPVDGEEAPKSSWCRVLTPMAGAKRGLVILPDVGTEVVLGFAYRSMSPYVLGAVYNLADDRPEPYHNDDEANNLRVFWSRNDHMVIFDDTPGGEKVEIAATASSRLDVTSGPIWQRLDSSQKKITEQVEKNEIWESGEKISVKCRNFELSAQQGIALEAGMNARFEAGMSLKVTSGAAQNWHAAQTAINPSAPPQAAASAESAPAHKHPPTSG